MKLHPRDFFGDGRVRVQIKKEGEDPKGPKVPVREDIRNSLPPLLFSFVYVSSIV
jgi:hypothetical protein